MKLNYNEKELHQLLQDFHDLTRLTLTLYDPEGEWIFSYPTKENYFCNCIKTSPEGAALCEASDRASFEAAKTSGECVIYKCHAGLIEATAPIVSDGFTIGYLMMGQVANAASPEQLQSLIEHALHKYHLNEAENDSWKQYAAATPCISDTQIHAAARIMEACISSILYKKLISIEKQQFEQNINTYILNHLTEDLSVDRLCEHLHLSRRKLYEYSEEFLHCSIAKYIKKMRLQHAQTLLTETNLPISTISEQCGFSDYNYFCRIFKQENGMSARSYRVAQQT
ncbi:MAG: PocR ligand-binding domain-containing protein [Lachnospiraceae bacterium]|jgi:AraC-like DNA-binding protein/ligand-binding sensor protein|uniref:PocR ligand-binding domain-containing protein n=1 Tax=Eubacterium ramulus TaxID=39490 RepID=UPI001D9CE6C5|nr:PocR ligand-binding domain-containing protein [Eubacterium ramulus]MBS5191242.1 PocR ligand-binding domain-containing protein [Lachnospiraceae bacterium]